MEFEGQSTKEKAAKQEETENTEICTEVPLAFSWVESCMSETKQRTTTKELYKEQESYKYH